MKQQTGHPTQKTLWDYLGDVENAHLRGDPSAIALAAGVAAEAIIKHHILDTLQLPASEGGETRLRANQSEDDPKARSWRKMDLGSLLDEILIKDKVLFKELRNQLHRIRDPRNRAAHATERGPPTLDEAATCYMAVWNVLQVVRNELFHRKQEIREEQRSLLGLTSTVPLAPRTSQQGIRTAAPTTVGETRDLGFKEWEIDRAEQRKRYEKVLDDHTPIVVVMITGRTEDGTEFFREFCDYHAKSQSAPVMATCPDWPAWDLGSEHDRTAFAERKTRQVLEKQGSAATSTNLFVTYHIEHPVPSDAVVFQHLIDEVWQPLLDNSTIGGRLLLHLRIDLPSAPTGWWPFSQAAKAYNQAIKTRDALQAVADDFRRDMIRHAAIEIAPIGHTELRDFLMDEGRVSRAEAEKVATDILASAKTFKSVAQRVEQQLGVWRDSREASSEKVGMSYAPPS